MFFAHGRELAEQGMERATCAQERRSEGWADHAMAYLKKFVVGRYAWSGEEFRNWAESTGLEKPLNASAYGGVLAKAKRDGLIVFVGYETSVNASRHLAPVRLWSQKRWSE
jgi:hypothetical protein